MRNGAEGAVSKVSRRVCSCVVPVRMGCIGLELRCHDLYDGCVILCGY